MKKNKLVLPFAALTLAVSAAGGMVAMASADTVAPATTSAATSQSGARVKPVAMGKVTAVNGSIITLTDAKVSTTYTVDATNATILKHEAPVAGATPTPGTKPAEATITVSQIAVGDMLRVEGTANGTSVTATTIHDGMGGRGGFGGERGPGVEGTVTAVNGTTLTVTGQDGKTYTVDGTSAKVSKMQTISVSDVTVGDTVGIDGTVSGTSVTATHIMDGVRKPTTASTVSS